MIQARAAFDSKNYQKAEAFLLRAERPDLAAKFYKVSDSPSHIPLTMSPLSWWSPQDGDMWTDALRIVKDYIPQKVRNAPPTPTPSLSFHTFTYQYLTSPLPLLTTHLHTA